MRSTGIWWIIISILIILDVYVFQAVKTVLQNASEKTRIWVTVIYWLIALLCWIALIALPYIQDLQISKFFRNYVFFILVGLFMAKLIASVFFLMDDIRRGIVWLITFFSTKSGTHFADNGAETISRSLFLSWMGIGMSITLMGILLYGFGNKYNYQIKYIRLQFANLPNAFKGLRIAQISDIHSGSFNNKQAVAHGVNMLLQQKPDLVLFTGDLVNDRYEEMNDYMDVFEKVKAPMGVYSTLGNHDYGDYVQWPSIQAKQLNLEKLKAVHAALGWRLLMNEHAILEKNGDAIALLGIENWGAKGRFPKYGKMEEAYPGTEKYSFKILMSHDPSHWDAEVRTKYPDIDLTLSGHTHGMQFGVETPFFKWSPVQWMYKQWAGLYQEGSQYLYVNRGYGFIGYPGRVGFLPEITIIELV
ncbi:MAG: metallophosphoesterase [Hydrotalea flava]|uniref:metallophosphoesterase n=1 Tax=Hydrotalea TaxID=1004300 RepID=UPI001027C529|nr:MULTISPECIES: metallophosphoesterase [Hydrotalea]MBY0348494.1 metallophosphoesterase [Hydrotalea flava]RWZ90202.1 MAG: metallophosphoesterase [Hydrotalea sp. AMD]